MKTRNEIKIRMTEMKKKKNRRFKIEENRNEEKDEE